MEYLLKAAFAFFDILMLTIFVVNTTATAGHAAWSGAEVFSKRSSTKKFGEFTRN